jgi:hypothetical protein
LGFIVDFGAVKSVSNAKPPRISCDTGSYRDSGRCEAGDTKCSQRCNAATLDVAADQGALVGFFLLCV